MKSLKTETRLLGTNYQVVKTEKFNNKAEGIEYLNMLLDDDYVFKDMDPDLLEIFIITPENYNVLVKENKVDEYVEFYRKVYE